MPLFNSINIKVFYYKRNEEMGKQLKQNYFNTKNKVYKYGKLFSRDISSGLIY